MTNETFGITLQYAICVQYDLEHNLSIHRIDDKLFNEFLAKDFIIKIFNDIKSIPIEFLSTSKKYTSNHITRCPHNFLLENGNTFSVRTFKGNGKMFAPKVVGQAGDETFNYIFGDLTDEVITRDNFKQFCITNISDILPILIDYSLISDYNCWLYTEAENYRYQILERADAPDFTFEKEDFTFSKVSVPLWNESNTVKYKGKTIAELQLHNNRPGYKMRLNREVLKELINQIQKLQLKTIKNIPVNNSLLGDTAELAICNIFSLESGEVNDRLRNNCDEDILKVFEQHYYDNKTVLFPLSPIKYSGTEKRKRGGNSKSGVDFYLEGNGTLSLKTNKSRSYKVCPPEIGQPSPKTFDLHFSDMGWYSPPMDEVKFRELVTTPSILTLLLKEYVKYLNECDYIIWTTYLDESLIKSLLVEKNRLRGIAFNSGEISYSNDFQEKSSVTIRYGEENLSIGEFQVHSARNSLKFRFNFANLLNLPYGEV